MKTIELSGAALDWAVAKCENLVTGNLHDGNDIGFIHEKGYTPSTDWEQGGPIIEREMITVGPAKHEGFMAWAWPKKDGFWGDSPLVAAMRCYVAMKLGDEVEVPEELGAPA
jgi:hypothetical protein